MRGREHVHDEAAVVEQDPLLARVSLDVARAQARRLAAVSCTASAMATICFWLVPGGEHEEVGESRGRLRRSRTTTSCAFLSRAARAARCRRAGAPSSVEPPLGDVVRHRRPAPGSARCAPPRTPLADLGWPRWAARTSRHVRPRRQLRPAAASPPGRLDHRHRAQREQPRAAPSRCAISGQVSLPTMSTSSSAAAGLRSALQRSPPCSWARRAAAPRPRARSRVAGGGQRHHGVAIEGGAARRAARCGGTSGRHEGDPVEAERLAGVLRRAQMARGGWDRTCRPCTPTLHACAPPRCAAHARARRALSSATARCHERALRARGRPAPGHARRRARRRSPSAGGASARRAGSGSRAPPPRRACWRPRAAAAPAARRSSAAPPRARRGGPATGSRPEVPRRPPRDEHARALHVAEELEAEAGALRARPR